MKYNRKFYLDTEQSLVKANINKCIDENQIESIKDFYDILFNKFKEVLIQEKEGTDYECDSTRQR